MKVKDENKEKFGSAMYSLVRAIKNEMETCCKLCGGINEKELIVIVYVGQNQNVKMSDIADNIEAPTSTLTNIVDKLVEKKYLSRDHSGEDRRVINVALTPKGKDAYKILITQKKLVAEKALSQFNEKEQQTFIKYINILSASIVS
jgi:DNA-binding MarR family transcriptional regulator